MLHLKMQLPIITFLTFISLSSWNPFKSNSHAEPGCFTMYYSVVNKQLYAWSDNMPAPRDGEAIEKHFWREFKSPKIGDDVQFNLHVVYIVDMKGEIKSAYIWGKEVYAYTATDKAGLTFIRSLSPMKPGYCNGKKVAFRMVFNVRWRESE